MYRGQTWRSTFTLPIEADSCRIILVSYRQKGVVINKKYQSGKAHDDIELDENKVIVTLHQKETMQFFKGNGEAQLRAITNDRDSLVSQQFSFKVHDVINDEVLSDGR